MTTEEEEARDRLLFHLEHQSGFWFAMVVGDDARPRGRLCEAAKMWCGDHNRGFTLHEPEPNALVALVVALASGESPGVHWIRADGVKGFVEQWDAGAAQMLMAMNERREAYRKRLDGGIVVEGRSSLKRILREMAPDLFSIRAFIAEPGEEPRARASDFPEWRRPWSLTSWASGDQVDPDRALERLGRLTALEGLETTEKWIDAEGLVVASLFNARRYEEAEHHARDLLSRLEQTAGDGLYKHTYRRSWVCEVLARVALITHDDVQEAIGLMERAREALLSSSPRDRGEQAMCRLQTTRVSKFRAHLLLQAGDRDAAMVALQEHVDMLSVPGLMPEMQVDRIESHLLLADLLEQQSRCDEAENLLQKTVEIAEQCAAEHPEDQRWQLEALRGRAALGSSRIRRYDIAAALSVMLPAASLAERLETYVSGHKSWRGVLEDFYFDLSFALSCQLNYSKPLDQIRQRALASMRQRFERNPGEVGRGWLLAEFYLQRAELLKKEDIGGAKDAARQALDLAARLPVRDDGDAEMKSKIDGLRVFVRKPRKRGRPTKS